MDGLNYMPQPIDTSEVELPDDLLELAETISKNTHEIWAKNRMEQGWRYGTERNDQLRQTPCLVSYEELPEEEKDYDRNTTIGTLKMILCVGYKIVKDDEKE